MGWLAFAILVLGTIYFAVHYRGFRRGLLFVLLGLVALAAVGGVVAWFHSQQEEHRRLVAKTLIKPEQKRAFRGYVRFDNLPPLKPNEWSWHYSIVEIVAARE
jgi:hypothetical protein